MYALDYIRKNKKMIKKDEISLQSLSLWFGVDQEELERELRNKDIMLYKEVFYRPTGTPQERAIFTHLYYCRHDYASGAMNLDDLSEVFGMSYGNFRKLVSSNYGISEVLKEIKSLKREWDREQRYKGTILRYQKLIRIFYRIKHCRWDKQPFDSLKYKTYLSVMEKASIQYNTVPLQIAERINLYYLDKYLAKGERMPRLTVELSEQAEREKQKLPYGMIRPVFEALVIKIGEISKENPKLLIDIISGDFDIVAIGGMDARSNEQIGDQQIQTVIENED